MSDDLASLRAKLDAIPTDLRSELRPSFGTFRHPLFRSGGVIGVPSYPLVGDEPSWLRTPYRPGGGCYGCGLEAEVMNPGKWALCFWCNELRLTLKSRERVPLWAV
jgi:hypothetical protein